MRGENERAVPMIGRLAVHAFRACEGCGWQNGKWLLMARINLFGPGKTPENWPVWEYSPDFARPPDFACPIAPVQRCFRCVRIGPACPAPVT
jgi:hypothetical protein